MDRLAYIFFAGDLKKSYSIVKKISAMSKSFNNFFVTNILIFYDMCNDLEGYKIKNDLITYIPIEKNLFRIFSYLIKLKKHIDLINPDFIILRDIGYFPLIYTILRMSKSKIYVDVQSVLFNELEVMRKNGFIEHILKRRYFRNIQGLLTITDEIAQFEMNFNPQLKTCSTGNGYSGSVTTLFKKCERYINLLFTGSPKMPWHNIERLLKSYDTYIASTGDKDTFKVHIVGMNQYDIEYQTKNENVIFYGYISNFEELSRIYQKADIGVGTLGLYKNNMKEAAPLKVREYLSFGLPVIIGYTDVDLSNDLPFVMQVENSDDLIDFSKIKKFYEDFKRYSSEEKVKDYCAKNLSWDKKCKEILDFINSS
jgi:glycosyltransferase involved in cell wall biosynthesis